MIRKIWDLATQKFVAESKTQFEKGMKTYGVPLTNFNGRDPFKDAREEVIDLHQYLTQAEAEFKTVAAYLYVYAVTEGFFGQLPKHIQSKLVAVANGRYMSEICLEEGIQFYGTATPNGPKNLSSGAQLGTPNLPQHRYSSSAGIPDADHD